MNSKHLAFECAIITITSEETYLMFTTKSFLVLYPTINCCFASCSPNRRHIHWAIKRHCNRPNNTNSSVVFYSKFSLDYCFYPAVPQFCSTTRTVRQKTKRNQQNLCRLTRYKLTAKWWPFSSSWLNSNSVYSSKFLDCPNPEFIVLVNKTWL